MKRYTSVKYLLLQAFVIIAGLSACEKVIDPDLSFAGPKIVIEAEVCDEFETHMVYISKTSSFYLENKFNGVNGAVVEVRSQSGQIYKYRETTPGVYRSSRFQGFPGQTYTLKVEVNGLTYTAKSTMPKSVYPDSITFKRLSFPGNDKVYPTINFKDPPQVQNQYRFLLKINAVKLGDMVTEDKFNNGNQVSELIFYEGADLKGGDQIEIELQSIDRNVFKYFYAISQIEGNGGPPVAPDNPISNFDNEALGVFSAHTSSTLKATLR